MAFCGKIVSVQVPDQPWALVAFGQWVQFNRKILHRKYSMNQEEPKESLDPWYVTGLIEGEGSFTYSRSGKSWVMIFAVKLNHKNTTLLQELLDFFVVGKIYNLGDKGSIFRVSKQEELEQIIDHFERFPLRGAKLASYQLWKQMVEIKAQSFRKTPSEELEELAKQLSASSIRTRD